MAREPIKDWRGKIIGWETTDKNGNKTMSGFTGGVRATYDAKHNVTKDFYGRKLTEGDTLKNFTDK